MAEGDFIILGPDRDSNDLKVISSQLANTRHLLAVTVDRFANMTFTQINNYYGTNLADAAARAQLVNQITAASAALDVAAVDNVIDYIG